MSEKSKVTKGFKLLTSLLSGITKEKATSRTIDLSVNALRSREYTLTGKLIQSKRNLELLQDKVDAATVNNGDVNDFNEVKFLNTLITAQNELTEATITNDDMQAELDFIKGRIDFLSVTEKTAE